MARLLNEKMASFAGPVMQRFDGDDDASRITLESQAGTPLSKDRSVERAAEHASAVARSFTAAGYQLRHLSVTFSETGDLVVVARLDPTKQLATAPVPTARAATVARPSPVVLPTRPGGISSTTLMRVAIGLTLGIVLGFLGLPRIELPTVPVSAPPPVTQPTPIVAPIGNVQQDESNPPPATSPPAPLRPTPIIAATPDPVVLNERFAAPLPNWVNDPRGTAWFDRGSYRLFARDSGHFVAVGVPLNRVLTNARVSADFQKLAGPPGGGYGLIVRDQGSASDLDGRTQAGEYIVLEVGDRGDIGIWQRDQTRWVDIVPWTHSDAVHADNARNSIVVTTLGNSLRFEVNGAVAADVTYDRLPPVGGVGVFAGGDINEVALQSLRIDNLQ